MGIACGALALKLSALVHGDAGGQYRIADFRLALLLIALLALLALVDAARLPRNAGAQIPGDAAS